MKHIVVIGGGIAGLSTAALLAKAGYKVTVLEKNTQVGGRARVFSKGGFHFDMGPSWYMMPDAFETYFAHVNKKPSDYFELLPLDPQYSVFFEKGFRYDISRDLKKDIQLFEKTEKGAGKKLGQFLLSAKYLYTEAMHKLIQLDYTTISQFLKPEVVLTAFKLQLLSSFHDKVKSYFSNPHLQRILEFTTVFLGGSPYNTPAFYTLIAHTDFGLKVFHPKGGISKVVEALTTLCNEFHVTVKTREEVISTILKDRKIVAVQTRDRQYTCDGVVSSADYPFTELSLIPKLTQTYPSDYWSKKVLSPSALIIYVGISKKLKKASHHNLFFADNWEEQFNTVYQKKEWPSNPSYYVHVPTVTDSSLAPKNSEVLIFLVPVAAGLKDSDTIRQKLSEEVITHFSKLIGENFQKNIVVKGVYSHRDFISDYNSYQGTAFGLAHTLTQTAFLRPRNMSTKIKNLFYAGQYTNPGIGMPMCLVSAQITSKLVRKNV